MYYKRLCSPPHLQPRRRGHLKTTLRDQQRRGSDMHKRKVSMRTREPWKGGVYVIADDRLTKTRFLRLQHSIAVLSNGGSGGGGDGIQRPTHPEFGKWCINALHNGRETVRRMWDRVALLHSATSHCPKGTNMGADMLLKREA